MSLRRGLILPPQYVGQVATRCYAPAGNNTNNFVQVSSGLTTNIRMYHYARDSVPWVRVLPSQWFGVPSGGGEVVTPNTGTALTVSMAIEYPAGSMTQVTWRGSPTVNVTATSTLAELLSDKVNVAIPAGAKFYTRSYYNYAVDAYYMFNDIGANGNPLYDFANGDGNNSTGTDMTMSGTITGNVFGNYSITPVLIVGPTRRPSVAIWGCNVANAYEDAIVANVGDLGYPTKAIGPNFGYVSFASESEAVSIASVATNSAIRRSLMQFLTHVVSMYNVDDWFNTGETTLAAFAGYFGAWAGLPGIAGKPIIQCCHIPFTNSTDGWATTTNQTVYNAGDQTFRAAINAGIRTGALPNMRAYSDACPYCEYEYPPTVTDIWNAPGFTTTGVHFNGAAGYAAACATFDTSIIKWPYG